MKLETINENHNVNEFMCENNKQNDFLKNNALIDNNLCLSKTFVVTNDPNNKVIAFYTLICSTLRDKEKTYVFSREIACKVPVLLLGQLAVDEKYTKQGIGSDLIKKIIQDVIELSQKISFAFIILDADNDKLIDYYQKKGFKRLKEDGKRMYLSVSEIIKTLSQNTPS